MKTTTTTLSRESQEQFITCLTEQFRAASRPISYSTEVKLSDLETMGFKYSSLNFGRDLDLKHCLDLYKDLQKAGHNVFTKKAIAISAQVVLEANKDAEVERIKVHDESGNELSLDTHGIESYLVFLDGNHRWFVHRLHPEVDLIVELAVVEDPFVFMANYNKLSNNWGIKDWLHADIQAGKIEGGIHATSMKVQDTLSVSMKYSNYLLTRERECVRKSELEFGHDTTVYNHDFVKRGMSICGALAFAFPKPAKGAMEMDKVLYRGVRLLQFLDAVEATDRANPSTEFGKLFAAFLVNLQETSKEILYRLFEEKDYVGLKKTMCSLYKEFLKAHELDLGTFVADAELKLAQALAGSSEVTEIPTVIKQGCANQIINSIDAVKAHKKGMKDQKDAQRNHDAAQKKLQKAQKDLETAQDKLLVADRNAQTATVLKRENAAKKLREAQEKVQLVQEAFERAKIDYEAAKSKLDSFHHV